MWNLMVSPGFTVLENSKIHNHAVGWECFGRGEGHCERSRESSLSSVFLKGHGWSWAGHMGIHTGLCEKYLGTLDDY